MASHIEQKNFSGILNRDDEDDVRPPDHHKMLYNGRFRGNGQNKRLENLPGTRLIPNADLPPGTNVTIGCFYDAPKQRLFWFVYNSLGANCIYIIYLTTESIVRLIQCGWNTDGDVLNFDIKYPIINAQIIYGDDQQGDILYWVNSQKLPCQININQQLAGSYGTVKKSFLDVAKEIPSIPPLPVYEDNATVTVNNLNGNLFQFSERFVFNNKDKSCWSARSVVPLPFFFDVQNTNPDPTINGDIAVVIQTGDTNVKKLEIAVYKSNGNQFADPFLVVSLDKDELGIPSNDIYIYRFFNDKAYTNIDLKESLQLFDLVPLEANAMELLNGNVLIYGGIKESYNPVTDFTNGDGDTTNVTVDVIDSTLTQQQAILIATQDGNTINGTGNIHIVVAGKIAENEIFDVADQNVTITYTAALNDTTTDVINGLAADAVSNGYTVVSSDDNNLYISKTNAQLRRYEFTSSADAYSSTDASFAYDWWSVYSYAIVYFDAKGRSCGAVTNPELSFSTMPYSETGGSIPEIPKVTLSIWHRPPEEAEYYEIVRSKNLSKTKFGQWITGTTLKDNVAGDDGYLYAYIGIDTINQFIKDKPAATFLAYDFAPRDRIRFIKLYPTGGSTVPILETNKDYEIQQQVINPIINAKEYKGQFLKIYLPATSISFDFGLQFHSPITEAIDYSNYFIELYTPTVPASESNNVYYEFGERGAIGDVGLATRYHQGIVQNQSTDLLTPAIFEFAQGDDYFRIRNINAAPEIKFIVQPQDELKKLDLLPLKLDLGFSVVGYTAKDVPNNATLAIPNDPDWFVSVTDGNAYTFNVRGYLVVQSLVDCNNFYIKLFVYNGVNSGYDIDLASAIDVTANESFNFIIDTSVTVLAGYKFLYIYATATAAVTAGIDLKVISGEIKINDANRRFQQFVIDANFSDSFQSEVNSNGRAWVVNPSAGQVYNGALLRWGLDLEINTNINRTNRFYDENFDEIDISKGDILRLLTMGRTLYVLQFRGVGWLGVYAKFIQDSSGSNQLTTTDEIITRNNVQYYDGEYGLGTHPESLFHSKNNFYFFDPIRGYWIRKGNNGLEPFSEIFKGQYYIRSLITPYNKVWDRTDGGYAKMLGCYDYFEEQALCILQGGTNGEDTLSPYSFAFNERNKGFVSFFNYYAEWITSVEDKLVGWLNGNIYFFDNTNAGSYNKFFGVQYDTYVEVSFNDARMIKKGWISMSQLANTIWEATEITTQIVMGSNNQQTSYLLQNHFSTLEGQYHANFRRASNSRGGIVNGQILKGGYMTIKLQPTDSSNFVYLSGLSVKWIDSPLTTH